MPRKYIYEDPKEEIRKRAFGWLADKALPTAEFLGTGFGLRNKPITEPFEAIVNRAKEADERMQADLPFDYKGVNELIAEQINPADVALAAAPLVGKGAKALSKVKAIQELHPLRSEIGAVGNINDLQKAEKSKKLLFDNDLAGATPRNIGTNPRAQGTNPRAIKSLPENELLDLETKAANRKQAVADARMEREFSEATNKSKSQPRQKVEPRKTKEKTPEELQKEADDAARSFEEQTEEARGVDKRIKAGPQNEDILRAAMGDEAFEAAKKNWLAKGGGSKPPNKPPETPKGSGEGPPKPPGPKDKAAPIERKASLFQNLFGLPKTLKTPFDIPLLRQGVVPALTHPKKVGWPALKAGAKSQFGTEKMYKDVVDEIASRPNVGMYEKYKMAIPDVGIRQEYPSGWAEQAEEAMGIRGPITRSQEGYDATMKTGRANLADLAIEEAAQKYGGVENIPEETMQGISNFTNDFTGYGRLGPLEKSADTLAVPFFSPRMIASRAQMMNPWNYMGGKRWGDVGKSQARRDMAKFVGGSAAGLGAIDYLTPEDSGVDVEWDPRSSDFGSVQANDTTFDLSGGMRPMINLAARGVMGEAKSTKDDKTVFDAPRGKTAGRFVRSKLAPGIPTATTDALFGDEKDYVGRPIDREYESGPLKEIPYLPWLTNQVSPMYPADVYEAFEQSGPYVGAAAAGLGMLGAGTQTYDRTPSKKKRRKPRANAKQ